MNNIEKNPFSDKQGGFSWLTWSWHFTHDLAWSTHSWLWRVGPFHQKLQIARRVKDHAASKRPAARSQYLESLAQLLLFHHSLRVSQIGKSGKFQGVGKVITSIESRWYIYQWELNSSYHQVKWDTQKKRKKYSLFFFSGQNVSIAAKYINNILSTIRTETWTVNQFAGVLDDNLHIFVTVKQKTLV